MLFRSAMQGTWFDPWVGKIPQRKERLPTLVFWPGEFHGLCSPWVRKESDMAECLHLYVLSCFNYFLTHLPGGSDSKVSAYSVGDLGSIPGLGRSPGEGNGNPLQCSCLETARDGGAWWAAVYGVAQSRTQLKRLSSSSSSKDQHELPRWLSGKETACQCGRCRRQGFDL